MSTDEITRDRSRLVPLLNHVEQLRLDLTAAANFVFGHWPDGIKAPEWALSRGDQPYGELRLTVYVALVEELRTMRGVLDGDGEATVLRNEHASGDVYMAVARSFGLVDVEVFTTLSVWERAYPEEVTS